MAGVIFERNLPVFAVKFSHSSREILAKTPQNCPVLARTLRFELISLNGYTKGSAGKKIPQSGYPSRFAGISIFR